MENEKDETAKPFFWNKSTSYTNFFTISITSLNKRRIFIAYAVYFTFCVRGSNARR
jgi:hypothetical protein